MIARGIPRPVAIVLRRQPVNVPTFTPGRKNIRLPERVNPHEAPDPIRQGAVPARVAERAVYTAFHESHASQDERFTGRMFNMRVSARIPRGRQTSFGPRANTRVPPHIAYGSLFSGSEPLYGHR